MMKLIKKGIYLAIFTSILLSSLCVQVYAEDPEYSDTNYWNNLCVKTNLSAQEKTACEGYVKYIQAQNSDLQNSLNQGDTLKNQLQGNIDEAAEELASLQSQVSGLDDMIADLNSQIAQVEKQLKEKQVKIDELQTEKKETQEEIDTLKETIRNRMVSKQSSMRLNQYLDVVMGAKTFNDVLSIVNGLNTINERDTYNVTTLNQKINKLAFVEEQLLSEQSELQTMSDQLQAGKDSLSTQQSGLIVARSQISNLQNQYKDDLDTLETAAATIADNNSSIGNINSNLNNDNDQSNGGDNNQTTPQAPSSEGSAENPYYGGWSNCTWGAWQLVHDNLGINLPRFGTSGAWLGNAAAMGYGTGSEPRANSIACYPNHVVFVTAVDGDRMYIKEGNYLGAYHEGWVNVSSSYSGTTTGFIYL